MKRRIVDYVFFDWSGTLKFKSSKKEEKKAKKNKKPKSKLVKAIKSVCSIIDYQSPDILLEHYNQILYKYKKDKQAAYTLETVLRESLARINFSEEKKILECVDTFFEYYNESVDNSSIIPGAIKLLETLKSQGIRMCLIRNSNLPFSAFQKVLQKCNMLQYFEVVVMGKENGYSKPNPEIFYHALKKMNLLEQHRTDSSRFMYVGNVPEIDVKGANRMGWQSVLLKLDPEEDLDLNDQECQPDYVVSHLLQTLSILNKEEAL